MCFPVMTINAVGWKAWEVSEMHCKALKAEYTLWSQLESGMLRRYDGIFYYCCGKEIGGVASVCHFQPLPFILG